MSQSQALATRGSSAAAVASSQYTREQVDLIKRTVARGASDDEFAIFMSQARRLGLDPFAKQIYSIRRWNSETRQDESVTQTGIDGLRVVAERTGQYRPGPKPTYTYDREARLLSATASVYRWYPADQQWHLTEVDAYLDEYIQTRKDGSPTRFWSRMPRSQLAKCAEALALRRAFPLDLSGVYAHEEMPPLDEEDQPRQVAPPIPPAKPTRARRAAAPAPEPATRADDRADDAVDAEVEPAAETAAEEPRPQSAAPGPAAAEVPWEEDEGEPPREVERAVADMLSAARAFAAGTIPLDGAGGVGERMDAAGARVAAGVASGAITKDERAWALSEYKSIKAEIAKRASGAGELRQKE
jgi:phage recombination protein Bet